MCVREYEPISLENLGRIVHTENWGDSAFTVQKAYACSLLSRLAYEHIPERERRSLRRFRVVPCEALRYLIQEGRTVDVRALLQNRDIGEVAVLERHLLVVIILKTPQVTFVTFRGTKYLYDWLTNLDLRKVVWLKGNMVVRAHRGFLTAIASVHHDLFVQLGPSIRNRTPIYLTGHSLGGALAAVFGATEYPCSPFAFRHGARRPNLQMDTACYTFGMPRYGDFNLLVSSRLPYNITRPSDIVPRVPPLFFGFAHASHEYMTDGRHVEVVNRSAIIAYPRWIASLLLGSGISNHCIERYVSGLRYSAGL